MCTIVRKLAILFVFLDSLLAETDRILSNEPELLRLPGPVLSVSLVDEEKMRLRKLAK